MSELPYDEVVDQYGEVIPCPPLREPATVEPIDLRDVLLAAAQLRADAAAPGVLAEWTSPGIAFLNRRTGDGRALTGDITAATPPLPLMSQLEDAHGGMPTMQSVMAGGINQVALVGDAFTASGVIDATPDGEAAAAAVMTGRFGVSVDLAVEEWEMVLDGEAWGWLFGGDAPPEDTQDGSVSEDAGLAEDGDIVIEQSVDDELLVITKGEIMGATIVPFPAFADARIEITASGEQGAPVMVRYSAPITIALRYLPPPTISGFASGGTFRADQRGGFTYTQGGNDAR